MMKNKVAIEAFTYGSLSYTNTYISKFLKILGVNVFDIYYDKDKDITFRNILDLYKLKINKFYIIIRKY